VKTHLLLASSALAMALAGAAALFLPAESLAFLHLATAPLLVTIVQLYGTLLLAFAAVNWMAKGSLIGGIYNRPLAAGNAMHFVAGAITLAKAALWLPAIVFGVFALAFCRVLFGKSPVARTAAG
jgi:hypothetical protein